MLAPHALGGLAVVSGGALSLPVLFVAASIAVGPTGQEPVACQLVDATSAELVLGSGATNPGGTVASSGCRYDKADGSLILMVQIFAVGMYDVMPINPQTPIEIGDRGRYGVGASGSANVQFTKGEFSVVVRVSPSHRSGPSAANLVEPLLEIAGIAADRMPN